MTHVARSLKLNCLVQLNTRILLGDALEEQLRQDTSYVCAYCEDQVNFRCGETVRAHFAHAAGTRCWIENHEDWGVESAEHQHAKFWLCAQIQLETGFQTQIEAVIGERERIADILVLAYSGARVAIEIQLSNISVERITERTQSYAKNNIDVIWLVGPKNIHLANQLIGNKYFNFYRIGFEGENVLIYSLKPCNPNDPLPQQLMMMDILRFMLAKTSHLANNGSELSYLLHGEEVDVVAYERYLNYNSQVQRRVNPFDLIEIEEKTKMRELFKKKREEENRKNLSDRIDDKEKIQQNYNYKLSKEKEMLSKNYLQRVSNGNAFYNDNFVMIHCTVVEEIIKYRDTAYIKVSARDPHRTKHVQKLAKNWYFYISVKVYSPSLVKTFENIQEDSNLIIYGYIERIKNKRNIWETNIIATGVDIL